MDLEAWFAVVRLEVICSGFVLLTLLYLDNNSVALSLVGCQMLDVSCVFVAKN